MSYITVIIASRRHQLQSVKGCSVMKRSIMSHTRSGWS